MYTHTIKSRSNGIATVEFSNGETETYTEQVIASEAQFATETTPFIPPVYETVEHTRPKVITATFADNDSLNDAIQTKLDQFNGVGAPVIPEPTAEELAQKAFMQAKMEWLQKKSILATMIDDMDRAAKIGKEPSAEQMAIMTGLAEWIDANMRQEYYF